MNKDYQKIKEDLATLGLKSGDAVMIHSSFKSMGKVEGGIEIFVNAVLSVIGDKGTLISPTLTFDYVTMEHRIFDYVNTPSCVGAISEYARHMDGAKRSLATEPDAIQVCTVLKNICRLLMCSRKSLHRIPLFCRIKPKI